MRLFGLSLNPAFVMRQDKDKEWLIQRELIHTDQYGLDGGERVRPLLAFLVRPLAVWLPEYGNVGDWINSPNIGLDPLPPTERNTF